ncbi:cell division protein FtsQ/DivIB [Paenibacillus sp. 1001270B_150601_E10]|uniref:cell division protein FtsQ/DivIB n=1 Tax=Paenibacillus sp. 1001270B_150601_E10 TaxID=2787079 RepID=UPI001E5FB095|nr:FtsQ-type POTRA domain-containing protein [Paenibacillus sp. 1001270B_150601_E10]
MSSLIRPLQAEGIRHIINPRKGKGWERLQVRAIPTLPTQPPKKRKSKRVIWIIVLLCLVLLGVLFFRSPISKITDLRFIGNTMASEKQLSEASGLTTGSPYFFSQEEVAGAIQAKYPFIQSVQMEKHFPGKVTIYVKEFGTVAYELQTDGQVLACLENGSTVILKQEKQLVLEKPLLTNWTDANAEAVKKQLSVALASIPEGLLADISEIKYDPSDSFNDRVKIYTRSGFEVITTVSLLPDKIAYLSGIVETQEPGRITMLQADSYISYTNLLKENDGE